MAVLRVILFAVVPSLLMLWGVQRLDRRREPWLWVGGTYLLGMLTCAITLLGLVALARWLDFDLGPRNGSRTSSFVFLFGVVAPVAELAKVAAAWPAFRSRHFDEPMDGIVYSGSAALGYAAVQVGLVLVLQPQGAMWVVRALLALPAQLFFASLWGYGLGRARTKKDPGPLFPTLWLVAVLLHGFYIYLLAGRGEGALIGAVPMVVTMGLVAAFAARDLARRSEAKANEPVPAAKVRSRRAPRSFREVQAALAQVDRGFRLRWVVFGALMMLGAMLLGFVGSVLMGHVAHVDFSTFDEDNIRTATPLLLLVAGVLAGMPTAGYLLARASEPPTLFEPALAALVAVVVSLVAFGMSGTMALVWGLSCAPAAWGFACAGAWLGRRAGAIER